MSAGEWIEHDGSGPPTLWNGAILDIVFFQRHDNRLIEPADPCSSDWPGWTWRLRRVRVGWFRSELRAVCHRPDFAPILRWRLRPSGALETLREIAANPPARILEDA